MKIIDVSAGNRAVWFNKKHPLCTFLDIRPEVEPDIVADSRELLPFDSESVDLAVFDPPHVNSGKNSKLSRLSYGWNTTKEICAIVQLTGMQLARVLKPNGLLAFKWNDHDQKLERILELLPQFEPLFGHKTAMRTKHASATTWVMLRKLQA